MKESYNECVAANTLHRAGFDLLYAYDTTPPLCHICVCDGIYDYANTGYASGITSSTSVATTFRGGAGFADNGGWCTDPAGGHEQESDESGMSCYGCRYYKPVLERWINRDPIEKWGGLNVLGFAGNRPLSLTDILGMQAMNTCTMYVTAGEEEYSSIADIVCKYDCCRCKQVDF